MMSLIHCNTCTFFCTVYRNNNGGFLLFLQYFDPVSEESGEFFLAARSSAQDGQCSSSTSDENNNPQQDDCSSNIDNETEPLLEDDNNNIDIPIIFSEKTSRLDCSLQFHDYEGQNKVPEKSFIRNQYASTFLASENSKNQCGVQTDVKLYSCSSSQTEHIVKKTVDIGIQTERPDLVYEDIENDNQKIMFYTGIPSNQIFRAIFDEIETDASAQTGRKNETGRYRTLRLIDEFLLVLMRLRLGLLLDDLADRFKISTSTCSVIFCKWIDYLYVQLEFLVKWPSRENIDATMPFSFKEKYPDCRVVIDCTEIQTETPSSLQLRSLLYSDYKSHMTYKSLVGISPAGVVTFVSDLYAGSISDKQITKLSGLVDQCEVGDSIMADKGFVISDLTTPKGVKLTIPPFKKKDRQFSKREVRETKNIANLRIHVERQMERIKNFRILQGVMPITMSHQATKIWKTCTRLTNLQPPLVLKQTEI